MSTTIKIPILGDFAVGKTSLLFTFTETEYEVAPIDIGKDYITYKHKYQGVEYDINFWDTNGSEQYGRVTSRVSECDGGIFVCAYDSSESIGGISKYLSNIQFTETLPNGQSVTRDPPFVIVCNKVDLIESGENEFSKEDFDDAAGQYSAIATFNDLDYCNWDAIYNAFKTIMDKAIETHLEWEKERQA